jgi:hypothetical protein
MGRSRSGTAERNRVAEGRERESQLPWSQDCNNRKVLLYGSVLVCACLTWVQNALIRQLLEEENDILELVLHQRVLCQEQDTQSHPMQELESARRDHQVPEALQQRVTTREGGVSEQGEEPFSENVSVHILGAEVEVEVGEVELKQIGELKASDMQPFQSL